MSILDAVPREPARPGDLQADAPHRPDTGATAAGDTPDDDRTRLGLPRHSTVAGTATISVLLGLLAATFTLVTPTAAGPGHGILVVLIGLGAVATGVRALHLRVHAPRAALLPTGVGITLGTLSTLAMLYTLVAFVVQPAGIALPDLPTAGQPGASSLSASDASLVSNPLGAAPATADEELAQLTTAAERTADALRDSHVAGLAWPSGLVEQDKGYPLLVSPDGTSLTALPADTRVTYSSFDSGAVFVFTMTGAKFGQKVHFNSQLGVVDSGH